MKKHFMVMWPKHFDGIDNNGLIMLRGAFEYKASSIGYFNTIDEALVHVGVMNGGHVIVDSLESWAGKPVLFVDITPWWLSHDEIDKLNLKALSKDSAIYIDENTGMYYFHDECWCHLYGPFQILNECKESLNKYVNWLEYGDELAGHDLDGSKAELDYQYNNAEYCGADYGDDFIDHVASNGAVIEASCNGVNMGERWLVNYDIDQPIDAHTIDTIKQLLFELKEYKCLADNYRKTLSDIECPF